MEIQIRPLAEITQRAIRVLCREIGAADTMRFVGQFTSGLGNYTEERDALFEGMELEDMIAAIKRKSDKAAPNTHNQE